MKSSTGAVKHSTVGIVSFAFACASFVLFVVIIFCVMKMASVVMEVTAGAAPTPETMKTFMGTFLGDHSGLFVCMGCSYLLFFASIVTSFVCGIISVFRKNVKKVFGIIGLVASSIVVAFIVLSLIFTLTSRKNYYAPDGAFVDPSAAITVQPEK